MIKIPCCKKDSGHLFCFDLDFSFLLDINSLGPVSVSILSSHDSVLVSVGAVLAATLDQGFKRSLLCKLKRLIVPKTFVFMLIMSAIQSAVIPGHCSVSFSPLLKKSLQLRGQVFCLLPRLISDFVVS